MKKKPATKMAACLWTSTSTSLMTTMVQVILKSYPCPFLVGSNLYVRSYMLKCQGAEEAGDKDDLLEERRRQRAAMRERRRKETREKIRTEEEMKGKKSKDKEKEERENRDKGNVTKVIDFHLSVLKSRTYRLLDSAHCPQPRPQLETVSRSTINDGEHLILFLSRVIEERSTI
jgi:hypothetical protein